MTERHSPRSLGDTSVQAVVQDRLEPARSIMDPSKPPVQVMVAIAASVESAAVFPNSLQSGGCPLDEPRTEAIESHAVWKRVLKPCG